MIANQTTQEIRVELDNKPGQLARISEALAKESINILGYGGFAHGNKGTVHLITSDAKKAGTVIEKLGLKPTTREVLTVNVPNKVGEFAKVTKKLADSGVNIDAAFPSYAPNGKDLGLAFCCDDIASAKKALQG